MKQKWESKLVLSGFHDFTVSFHNSFRPCTPSDLDHFEECHRQTNDAGRSPLITNCRGPTRFVAVRGFGKTKSLAICELEVFGRLERKLLASPLPWKTTCDVDKSKTTASFTKLSKFWLDSYRNIVVNIKKLKNYSLTSIRSKDTDDHAFPDDTRASWESKEQLVFNRQATTAGHCRSRVEHCSFVCKVRGSILNSHECRRGKYGCRCL